MTTDSERIAMLEARIDELEASLEAARSWMNVMYQDMLKLQFSAAKAIKGDRDGANEIFKEVEKNARILAEGAKND